VARNQRMVLKKQAGSVTFWAWMVSLVVHLLVLAVFGLIRLSNPSNPVSGNHIPAARVTRLKTLLNKDTIIPKPKVKKPSQGLNTQKKEDIFSKRSHFIKSSAKLESLSLNSSTHTIPDYEAVKSHLVLGEVKFFGSSTHERKICYIVDCSGSMQGLMGKVKSQLKDSISNLLPDQYFYIIFFGDNALFESGHGKLTRATEKNKKHAYSFVSTIRAGGRTNAFNALERAVNITDNAGHKASVFYFLTDGFELTKSKDESLNQETLKLIANYAPDSKINVIGYSPTEQGRIILQSVAALSGGEFVMITTSEH